MDERSCRKRTFKEIGMHLQMIYVDDKVVKYMVFIFMYFLTRINLLTLRCFVAEVRWLRCWVKTIATWKTVIESMQSLGMDN